MSLIREAQTIAEELLADPLPRRWAHVQSVGAQANDIGRRLLEADDVEIVAAAGWLHDIGYTPTLAETGFHPLDGARWLRQQGFPEPVVDLVAHHTCAVREARLRGLETELREEFPGGLEPSMSRDVVWYADLTTGPDGRRLTVRARLSEIRERYGPEHLVTRFINSAEADLLKSTDRVDQLLSRYTARFS